MFKENFLKICAERNVSPTTVCKSIGLSACAFSKWTEDSIPRKVTLVKLSNYFDVPVSYFTDEDTKKESQPNFTTVDKTVYSIPVFETVSAGIGSYANSNAIGHMAMFASSEAEADSLMFLKVKGNSMMPKIEEGDLILVKKQESVDSGSVAVVLVDGDEGFVKEIVYGKNWLELRSYNKDYKTMSFDGTDMQRVQIVGKVQSIVKKV